MGRDLDLLNIEHQEVLDLISRHCPGAMSAYLHCFNRIDSNGSYVFSRRQIDQDLSETYTKFKNDIKKLAREDLLEWHELDDHLHVKLVMIE